LLEPDGVATVDRRALPTRVDASWWVVGDGVDHFADALQLRGCRTDAALLPRARSLLTLGARALSNGESVESAAALPEYLQGTRPWRKQGQ
jgi:tRNA A37 threonylcarbamoyladenosine modification protein TsaB